MSDPIPLPLQRLLRHNRVLLLQGPMGPFFEKLGQFLQSQGVEVNKLNFNGGDCLYSKNIQSVSYKGQLRQLHDWLEAHARQLKIDAFVLFGQTRPIHQIAIHVAEKLGITLHIFEEGYVRPDYVTLEEGGVNALSALPRDANVYLQSELPPTPAPQPTGQRFRTMAITACMYATARWLGTPFFPQEVYHRPLNPLRLTYLWAGVGLWRKLRFKVKERNLTEQLTSPERSKKFFFLPLQVHNDSQITHYSPYESIEAVIQEVLTSFQQNADPADWLVIKHHPFDRPFREYSAYIQKLSRELGLEGRVLSVHDLHLPTLIKNSKGVICVNSTTGIQALGHKTPVAALSDDCFYGIDGLVQANRASLNGFWKNPGAVNYPLFQKFRDYLVAHSQINASFYAKQPCFEAPPLQTLAVQGDAGAGLAAHEANDNAPAVSIAAEVKQELASLEPAGKPPVFKPRSHLQVAWSVWRALFMRETLTRLSGQRMGWLWLLLDPVAQVAFLMVMFTTMRVRSFGSIDFALFLAIGVMGYKMFITTGRRSGAALNANKGLLAYRQVLPVDTVISRISLEVILQFFVALILLAGAALFGFDVLPHDPLSAIAAFSLLALMGGGLGFVLSAIFELVPESEKIVNLLFVPLYFASGIMYSPSALPYAAQQVLLYNPLVHGIELLRGAFFDGYHVMQGISWDYLAGFGIGLTLLGLALHRRFDSKLMAK